MIQKKQSTVFSIESMNTMMTIQRYFFRQNTRYYT
jgi:hypothetical protein